MPAALGDLLFWIVGLIALFFLLRWLQKRQANKDLDE